MTSILKRISLSLDRPSARDPKDSGATLASHPSFNDFSFHAAMEVHEVEKTSVPLPGRDSIEPRPASTDEPRSTRASPFAVGSAPAGLAPILAPRTAALRIPKPSVAHALSAVPQDAASATPKSVVDTPRRSQDMPTTPRSPTSPTGRRRSNGAGHPRSPKIDGMDYYDWAELLRSSSL